MKPISLFTIILAFVFFSCGSSSSSSSQVQDPHSKAHQQMHNELFQEEIQKALNNQVVIYTGSYGGVLPCEDCDEIEFKLSLLENMNFRSETIFKGKSKASTVHNGTYIVNDNGIVQLDQPVAGMTYFVKQGENLKILSSNGQEIAANSPEMFLLKPIKTMVKDFESDDPKAQFYGGKWNEGIVFFAGNKELNWTLNLYKSGFLKFTGPNNSIFTSQSVSKLPSIDPKIIDFRAVTDKGEILIHMVEKNCEENTFGFSSDYSITIKLKMAGEKEEVSFSGCGDFIPDAKLSGNWSIYSIGGSVIDQSIFEGKKPSLLINLYTSSFSGNDGCNLMNGTAKFKIDKLSFGPTAGTLMACPNMEISNKIVNSFSSKSFSYLLEEYLILFDQGKEVMVLKSID